MRDFEIGDRVSFKWGSEYSEEGVVINYHQEDEYPVKVLFDDPVDELSFTDDGVFDKSSSHKFRLSKIKSRV